MPDLKSPESWVDGWRWDGAQFVRVDPQDATMSLYTLREIASLAGLHIVSEAERKVLDACAEAEQELNMAAQRYPELVPLIEALARRNGT